MAKDQKDKINELKLKLGDLAYRQGKQAVICNAENEKLRLLQRQANEVATEIEKLGE
ncbi:MAG: hypothetical protein ACYTEO_20005 [Planctomycetota bacterium]|jgi:hypothetical protein